MLYDCNVVRHKSFKQINYVPLNNGTKVSLSRQSCLLGLADVA